MPSTPYAVVVHHMCLTQDLQAEDSSSSFRYDKNVLDPILSITCWYACDRGSKQILGNPSLSGTPLKPVVQSPHHDICDCCPPPPAAGQPKQLWAQHHETVPWLAWSCPRLTGLRSGTLMIVFGSLQLRCNLLHDLLWEETCMLRCEYAIHEHQDDPSTSTWQLRWFKYYDSWLRGHQMWQHCKMIEAAIPSSYISAC